MVFCERFRAILALAVPLQLAYPPLEGSSASPPFSARIMNDINLATSQVYFDDEIRVIPLPAICERRVQRRMGARLPIWDQRFMLRSTVEMERNAAHRLERFLAATLSPLYSSVVARESPSPHSSEVDFAGGLIPADDRTTISHLPKVYLNHSQDLMITKVDATLS